MPRLHAKRPGSRPDFDARSKFGASAVSSGRDRGDTAHCRAWIVRVRNHYSRTRKTLVKPTNRPPIQRSTPILEPEATSPPVNPSRRLENMPNRKKNAHQGQVPTPYENAGKRLTRGPLRCQLAVLERLLALRPSREQKGVAVDTRPCNRSSNWSWCDPRGCTWQRSTPVVQIRRDSSAKLRWPSSRRRHGRADGLVGTRCRTAIPRYRFERAFHAPYGRACLNRLPVRFSLDYLTRPGLSVRDEPTQVG